MSIDSKWKPNIVISTHIQQKLRIFLKGLINSSKIAPGVYEKGPTTIEDAIGIVKKISSAQRIAASFSQNHQISMMKRGSTNHHTPSQDC